MRWQSYITITHNGGWLPPYLQPQALQTWERADPDITFIGATVDKLGFDEGGPLGGVEHLVDLLAPGRLPEREPDYVVHNLQVTPASLK